MAPSLEAPPTPVPALAHLEGRQHSGGQCQPALDLADADSEATIDGRSILPTLLGNTKKQKKHEYLYWEFFEQGGRQAVRMGDWKGIRYDVNKNHERQIELYDLSDDIGEKRNVAADNPKVVKKLDAILKKARTESPYFKFRHEM